MPNGGFSAGGHIYGIYTTDASPGLRGEVMGRSVLGRTDDGKVWRKVFDLSRDKFINVAPAVVDAGKTPGLPIAKGQGLLLWASGRQYRRSSPHLAFVPVDKVEDLSAYRYWTGSRWASQESEAMPLFVNNQIGELSVAWCGALKRWLMTYNSGRPRGILIRTAERPTGPWSEPVVLFDPKNGYGKFMHVANGTDGMNDPGREKEFGGEYAPYMIPRFFKKTAKGVAIYFLMSIWNPYNVVLMRAEIKA